MAAIELLETTPAEKFWDMHFLGNGRLGASVKGEPYFETIAIMMIHFGQAVNILLQIQSILIQCRK